MYWKTIVIVMQLYVYQNNKQQEFTKPDVWLGWAVEEKAMFL